MGNSLDEDLHGKYVILRDKFKHEDLKGNKNDYKRVFLVGGGFGASAHTMGTALMGTWVRDGERCRMEGYDVERYATEKEIEKAEKERVIFDDMTENYTYVQWFLNKEDAEAIRKQFRVLRVPFKRPKDNIEFMELYKRYHEEDEENGD